MILLIPIAFISGLLTALSPCVLPILPIILGSGADGKKERSNGIIAGLIFSFTFFTLLLSYLVSKLGIGADALRNAAVVLLIGFGILLLFPKYWDRVSGWLETKLPKPKSEKANRPDFYGGILTGGILGLVWTPCVGPIVAAVVTLSAVNDFSIFTVLLTFSFSLGIGIPLFVISRGGVKAAQKFNFAKKGGNKMRKAFGVIIILTAIFIGSGYERRFQAWAVEKLPKEWSLIGQTFESKLQVSDELKKIK